MTERPVCPNCLKQFSLNLNNKPILLECGHTFCHSCLTRGLNNREKKKTISCFKCKHNSHCNFENNKILGLVPNIAVLGYIGFGKPPEILSRVKLLTSKFKSKKTNDKIVKQKCSECIKEIATISCVQCGINLCTNCYDFIHKNSRVLQRHQSIPCQNVPTLACKNHRSLTEFYCVDDKLLICRDCICAYHSQHKIILLREKAIEMREDVKTEVDECASLISLLKNLVQEVEEEIKEVEAEAVVQSKNLLQIFLDVVGMAQSNLFRMLNELEKMSVTKIQELITIRGDAVNRLEVLKCLCSDASVILNAGNENEIFSVNPLKIMEELKKVKDIPCVLEKDLLDEEKKLDVKVKEEKDENQNKIDGKSFSRFQFIINDNIFSINKEWGSIKDKQNLKYSIKNADLDLLKQIKAESTTTESGDGSDILESNSLNMDLSQMSSISNQELVYVIFINNPEDFFVQRERDRNQISQIENQLKMYNNRPPRDSEFFNCIRIGELCVAKYNINRKWYRCRVTKVFKKEKEEDGNNILDPETAGANDEIEVFFIDYGNFEKTKVSCIRSLSFNLQRIPPLAIPCSIVGISPIGDSWSLEAGHLFTKLVANELVLMTTIARDTGRRFADLHKPAPDDVDPEIKVSVREAMLFLNKATFSKDPIPTSDVKSPRINLTQRAKYLTPTILTPGSFVPAVICNFHSLDSFCIQLTDSNGDYLNKMTIKIQQFCQGKLFEILNPDCPYAVLNPTIDLPCLAYCDEYEMWFRANVISVFTKEQKVKVLFVDYGNEKLVNVRETLLIPKNLMELPYQALRCKLSDVKKLNKDEDWTSECKDRFLELASNDNYLIVDVRSYDEGIYKVELFDDVDYQADYQCLSINKRLVREGFAEEMIDKKANDFASTENEVIKDAENFGNVNKESLLLTPEINFDLPTNQDTVSCQSTNQKIESGHLANPNTETITLTNQNTKNDHSTIRRTEQSEPNNQNPSKDDDKIKIRVLVAKSPASIYVKTNEQWKKCNNLVKLVHKHYSADIKNKDEFKELERGNVCAIYSSIEKRWCRGILESVNEDKSSIVVNLVDFGRSEVTSLSCIQPLKKEFCVDKPLLTHCCLSFILPAGGSHKWTSNACQSLQDLVLENDCAMMITGDLNADKKWMPTSVKLFVSKNDETLEVNKELVMQGFALPDVANTERVSDKPLSNFEMTLQIASERYQKAEAERLQSSYLPWPIIPIKDNHDNKCEEEIIKFDLGSDCIVKEDHKSNSHINSPHQDVQNDSSESEEDFSNKTNDIDYKFNFKQISNKISKAKGDSCQYKPAKLPRLNKTFKCKVTHIERFDIIFISITASPKIYSDEYVSQLPVLTNFEPGTPCFACFSEDNQWNRAKVLARDSEKDLVLVEYVDFGLTEILEGELVRCSSLEMLSYPIQAIMCILTDVKLPENIPEMSVLEIMANLIGSKVVMCKIISLPQDGQPVVKLYLNMANSGEKDHYVPFISQLEVLLAPLVDAAKKVENESPQSG